MRHHPQIYLRGDGLNVVIEVKLVRMRTQADRINLSFPFVSEPSFDHILRENVTAKEKSLIVLKRIKGLVQRAGRRFHALRFHGWQIIKVFLITPTLPPNQTKALPYKEKPT